MDLTQAKRDVCATADAMAAAWAIKPDAIKPDADKAVLDGAKTLAMTALDLVLAPELATSVQSDLAATAEASALALEHAFHGAGCGCH
jgi:hypothetical protein